MKKLTLIILMLFFFSPAYAQKTNKTSLKEKHKREEIRSKIAKENLDRRKIRSSRNEQGNSRRSLLINYSGDATIYSMMQYMLDKGSAEVSSKPMQYFGNSLVRVYPKLTQLHYLQ